ncbi:MAG: MoaD/ThiS family protein, partial [Selenomonas sp.]|nr:MoaD/ThiS family protein [Selenomonas sp.]
GDSITSRMPESFGEVLRACGLPPQGRRVHYRLNGEETSYVSAPVLRANDLPASLSLPVHEGDRLTYGESSAPTLGSVLGITELDAALVIYYEGIEHKIPSAALTLKVGGVPVSPDTPLAEGADVTYEKSERKATTVSDALVAVGFEPPAATSRVSAQILVNGAPVDFTAPIKNGDTLAVKLTPLAGAPIGSGAQAASPETAASAAPTAGTASIAAATDTAATRQEPAADAARTTSTMRATAAAEHTDNPSTTGASLTSKATAGAADTASPRYTSLTEALGLTAPPAETNAAAQPKKPVISIADLTRND